jgi:predicted  nucleic acid-binding Zn-ribbon protein
MGLKELDLLKTTLLKIDDVDNEVKQLRDESKNLRKNIKKGEKTITKRKLEISNLEQEIPTLENNLENNLANIGERKYSSSSEDLGELNKLKDDICIIEKRKKKLIEKWKKDLDKVPSEGFLPIYAQVGLLLCFGLPLGLVPIGFNEGGYGALLCGIIWLLLLMFLTGGGDHEISLVKLHRPNRRQLKLFAAEIVKEHGPFDYQSPRTVNGQMHYSKNNMYASCAIDHYIRDKKHPIVLSENKEMMDEAKKILYYEGKQPLPRELVDVNSSYKKYQKSISALSSRIASEMDKVRVIDNQKSEIIKMKQSITKKQSLIDKEKSSAKRKEKQVDTNATKVKELKKERKELWGTISHLIPYSDLIN